MHPYTVDASSSQSESVLPYQIIEGRGSRVISLASREVYGLHAPPNVAIILTTLDIVLCAQGQAVIGRSTAVALANRVRKVFLLLSHLLLCSSSHFIHKTVRE